MLASPDVQNYLANLYQQANFVVLKEHGRDYTAPVTLARLDAHTVQLINNRILEAYARQCAGFRHPQN